MRTYDTYSHNILKDIPCDAIIMLSELLFCCCCFLFVICSRFDCFTERQDVCDVKRLFRFCWDGSFICMQINNIYIENGNKMTNRTLKIMNV